MLNTLYPALFQEPNLHFLCLTFTTTQKQAFLFSFYRENRGMKILNNLLRSSQLLSVRAWIQTQEDWLTNYILFPFCLSWAPATHVLKTKLIIFNHKSSLISWLSSTKKHHTILSNSLFNDLIPFPFTPYLPWIIVILQYLLTSLFLPLIPAYSIHAPFYKVNFSQMQIQLYHLLP